MPRSFLVKSQRYRDKERRRGLGIAKLVYDPTRAASVITTLAKPEPRRPVITFVQATVHPQPRLRPWEPRSITTSCGPVLPRSTPATEGLRVDTSTPTPPVTTKPFFRPFLPLPLPQRTTYHPPPRSLPVSVCYVGDLQSCLPSPSSDGESRLPSPGSDGGETHQAKRALDRRRKSSQKLKCPDCGKEYCTAGGLSKHQQMQCSAGQNSRAFTCKYCGKEYTALGALKMHLRTHTLPCKCTICGKAFSRPWLLQGHIRTHTGEKPFSCAHCQRAFADRSNLRAHLQTHSHVKRYSCVRCAKTFSRMSLLNKHTKSGCEATGRPTVAAHPSSPTLTVGGDSQMAVL